MPYAPTVNDNSGQILAQGINQGIAGLADGIQRSIAERKKKEEERRAKEAVNAAGKGLFGEDFDVKDAKPDQYGMIIQMAQQKKEEPLRALALENEGLKKRISQSQLDQYAVAAEQQARNQAALRGAFNPTTGTAQAIQGGADFQNLPGPNAMDAEAALRYMGGQGADAATMQNYSQTVENMAQAKQRSTPKPEKSISYLNPPEGAQWMKDENGNVHNLTPKRDPNARREFEVGGRKMVEESGKVFDGKTGELVGAAKPLDPDTQSRLATRLSAAQAEAEKPKGMFESAADYTKRTRDARMKANLAAAQLGYAPPFEDALTPQGQVATPKPATSRFRIVAEPSK